MASLGEQQFNEAADFWRHDIGVNVIPADTRNKRPIVAWTEWQDKPIPEELHNQWKSTSAFNKGLAVVLGKVWHHYMRTSLYLVGIDLDNQKAIEEVALRGLEDLARSVIVEQHKDDPTKAHILFYSHKVYPKKSSDNANLQGAANNNEIPAIKVKGLGSHGVLYVSPSVHKNGHPYEIIGPCKDPVILDDFIDLIDNICRKYNIPYLDAAANNNSRAKIPIEELFKDDFTVQEGHNRHEALLRVMESLIARNIRILALDEIREFAKIWNDSHCSSPLDDREFQKQWKCATAFIDKKASAEKGDNKYKSKDETLDLADELRQKFHFKTVKVIKDIYYFDSRRYVKNGNIVIESELEARYLNALAQSQADPPKPWTRKKSDEIIGQVEQRTYVDISAFDADMEWLACDNCMLNLRTGQTAPFSPSFMNTTCIPVKYSDVYATGPAADFFRLVEQHNCNYDNCQCPKIMKFLHDIVEPEDVEILLDFIAYCLWRDYKYAHWLLLNGYGQNGKSVLLNLIELFLGKDNTSAESLERLLKEKFAIAISEVS